MFAFFSLSPSSYLARFSANSFVHLHSVLSVHHSNTFFISFHFFLVSPFILFTLDFAKCFVCLFSIRIAKKQRREKKRPEWKKTNEWTNEMRDLVRIHSIRSSRLRIRIRIHCQYLHFAMRCNVAQFISCVFGVDGTITISDFYTVDHDILRKHCPLLMLLAVYHSFFHTISEFRCQWIFSHEIHVSLLHRRSPKTTYLISICHHSGFLPVQLACNHNHLVY